MEQKRKINAKKFAADLRAGASDIELMHIHDLDRSQLDKVIKVLVQKGVLSQQDLDSRKTTEELSRHEFAPKNAPSDYPDISSSKAPGKKYYDPHQCPQCGADVSPKALTCRECGHVLPGEERWSGVEPKQSFFERVPPLVVGIVIAIPIGILLLYVFRDIIIPMGESYSEKRADAVRKELPQGKTPIQAAKDLTKALPQNSIKSIVQQLRSEDILSSHDDEYKRFTVGLRWEEMAKNEQMRILKDISGAMQTGGLEAEFEVYGIRGEKIATVNGENVQFTTDFGGFPPGPTTVPTPPLETENLPEVPRSLDPRGKIKFP